MSDRTRRPLGCSLRRLFHTAITKKRHAYSHEAESALSWTRESFVHDGVIASSLQEDCKNGTSDASTHYHDSGVRHLYR